MLITVAWTEVVTEWDGVDFRGRDLGRPIPNLTTKTEARACVWVFKGTSADLAKAQAFVDRDYPGNGWVLTFPETEADPIERAKEKALDLAFKSALKEKSTKTQSDVDIV